MKLTAIFLLAVVFQVNAKGNAQTVTYSAKSAQLATVFTAIEKQTGYVFFYRKADVKHVGPVSVELKAADIKLAVETILKGADLKFSIKGNTILISKADGAENSSPRLIIETAPPVVGVVRGADGQALAGVNIAIKGSKRGTVTDNDGRFQIEAKTGDKLVISSIGYAPREIVVIENSPIYISLEISTSALDEIQIIAYGTTTRRTGIGNVSTVKAKDIEMQPVNNSILALQNKVPGLVVTQATGMPGSGVIVRIQGENSLQRGNDPLYVIDGVPYFSQMLPTTTAVLGRSGAGAIPSGETGSGNPLSFLNPADIESINVLKDAEATSIYGSRAANGAILITTKRGRPGKTKIDLSARTGIGQVNRRLKLMNTSQYLMMRKEGLKNDNATPADADYDVNGTWDTTRNTDWQKELFGGAAKYTDAQASLSGGSSKTQFLVGTGYHKETTVFPGRFNDQKGSLHFSLTNTSDDQRFKFQLSANYLSDNNYFPGSDPTSMAVTLAPNAPALYNADGSYNWAPDAQGNSSWGFSGNPAANFLTVVKMKSSNLVSNMNIAYELVKGLTARASVGFNEFHSTETYYNPLERWVPQFRQYFTAAALYSSSTIRSYIVEPQLTYNREFSKLSLETLLGTTFQQNRSDGQVLYASGFNSDLELENIMAAPHIEVYSSILSQYRYNALFGRAHLAWDNKYVLHLSARRDASSRFGPENRFNNFAAVGAGWMFGQEDFIKNGLPLVSYGKLTFSYGTSGNDQIGNYQYLNLYSPTPNIGVPYQGATGLTPNGLPNPYLQWEETKKIQAGLELGILNDRLLFTMNYYRNRSSNQLLQVSLPLQTGFPNIFQNLPALVENKGFEFSLNSSNIIRKHFRWNTNFNFTVASNKLVTFPDLATSTLASLYEIGQPTSLAKLYNYAGIDPATGVAQFTDAKGTVTTEPSSATDRYLYRNLLPTFYGGLQNTICYRRFELDFLLGFKRQIAGDYSQGFTPGIFNTNQPVEVLSRWQKPGDVTDVQKFVSMTNSIGSYHQGSQLVIKDASYIRLRNLSLSYSLPLQLSQSVRVTNMKVFLQAQNLFTISDYVGLDPETLSMFSLPSLRIITAGLSLSL